jgi:hypothetical protein
LLLVGRCFAGPPPGEFAASVLVLSDLCRYSEQRNTLRPSAVTDGVCRQLAMRDFPIYTCLSGRPDFV